MMVREYWYGSDGRSLFCRRSPILHYKLGQEYSTLGHARGKTAREPFIAECRVDSIALSFDAHWVASGHFDGSIRLWNLDAASPVPKVLKYHSQEIRSIAFSSDERKLVTGSFDNSIRVWDVESGKTTGVRLWNVQAYEPTYEPIGDPSIGNVNRVCFSFDSKYVSGFDNGSVCVWNIGTRSLVCELRGHTNMVSAVAFSPDGRNILSGSSDGIVRVWNIKENTPVPQQSVGRPLANRVFRASYVPKSGLIAYVLLDGTINLRDAYTGAMAGKPS